MLFITKIKSFTDPKTTVYTILYNAMRKILYNMDSLKNPAINHQHYDMMVSTNNLLKGLLDVNTICTHNLINLVNRLWTIVNYLGSEIRRAECDQNDILYTNLQNEYFTVFLELNALIGREIEELQKAKYDERDICTAIAAAAIGDHIKHVHFCSGDCPAAGGGIGGGGGGGSSDDDNVFFDIVGEPISIPELEVVPPSSSPPGACRKKIISYDEAPEAVGHELSTVFEEEPAAGIKKQNMCIIM